jgi:hypothetical protein
MAKGLPYFKFTPTEWLTGDICYEDFEVQGLFINICALYWQRDGKLSVEDINRRYKKPTAFDLLIGRFISVIDGLITIDFLDEQLHERGHQSVVNSANGKLGGRPKTKGKKPNANRNESEEKAKKRQQEEEEEKEKELNKNNIESRKLKFANTLTSYLGTYGKEFVREFYDYWTEPNKSNTLFKQELERTWSLERRLGTWARNERPYAKTPIENKPTLKEYKPR